MKRIHIANKKISKCKKLILGMMLLALFMTLPTTNMIYAKEKKITVPNLPHKGCDELGIKNIQETKYSKTTYFRWETVEDKKEVEFYYALHIYAEKKGKISRVKSISAEKFGKKTQKILSKCLLEGACLDYNCKYLYLPTAPKNRNIYIVCISLESGKVKKTKLERCLYKYINTPYTLTQKQVENEREGYCLNTAYCKFISPNYLGVVVDIQKCTYPRNANKQVVDDEMIIFDDHKKVFFINLKKNKIIKKMKCYFDVYSMNEKNVVGLEKKSYGKLCIKSWNGKQKRIKINNPMKSGSELKQFDTYRYVHTTFISGNKVHFSTRAGIFSYNMKTKKIKTLLNREKSKELKKNKYVTALSVDKKKQLEILVSRGWRSSYKLIKIV